MTALARTLPGDEAFVIGATDLGNGDGAVATTAPSDFGLRTFALGTLALGNYHWSPSA
ncbi:MAG TPA: hypothetical protein VM940_07305 [Chthoniobacterales bacterium]|nr:hypothetical protein [Chthoniobacterales bacterium]